MPDGDPEHIKIIDKMNWTGVGLEIGRRAWPSFRNRDELSRTGIYVLIGYGESEDKPTLYIGQGDATITRIDAHSKEKEFWDRVIGCTSTGAGLNRAHATWLESLLISKAQLAGRCLLDNSASPKEPSLSESERSDVKEFCNEILGIFPLLNLRVFEKAEKVGVQHPPQELAAKSKEQDTIVVPALEEGFLETFINDDCWYAIRIGGGKLDQIKNI